MVMPGAQGLRRDSVEIGQVTARGERPLAHGKLNVEERFRKNSKRQLLFEQLCESGASVIRRARGSLTFDDSARRKQLAGVARVLVHDACRHRFAAFKPRAGIEIVALPARMQLRFTGCATGFGADGSRDLRAARRALHRLAIRHHLRRAWSFTFNGFRLRLGGTLRLAIVIHVAALAVFAVTHAADYSNPCFPRPKETRI